MNPIFPTSSVPVRSIRGSSGGGVLRERGAPQSPQACPSSPKLHPFSISGFSLIELLVVIAIIVILAVIALPAIRGISGGTGLTSAAEEFVGAANLARQRASTFNRQVAIRFWKEGSNYTSYQIWEQKHSAFTNSWRAVERERKFQVGVVVMNHGTNSSMLTRFTGTTNGRDYAQVLFTPAGALVASTNQTAVSFIQANGPQSGGIVPGLPPNFATVVIDPLNGIPRLYRP